MAASGSFADTNRSLKAASAGIAGEEFYPGNISYPPAEVFEAEAYDAYQAAGPAYVSAETDTGGVIHLVIMSFFLSGCLILGVMIVYEIVVWRREKKFWDDLKNPKE